MTEGSARPVAQVGSDPQLVAFGDDVRRQALMPGWDFQSAQSNEPAPVEVAYRWSWADVLRPMMVHHENRSATEPAFLFSFSSTDRPILEAFGIYREEARNGA